MVDYEVWLLLFRREKNRYMLNYLHPIYLFLKSLKVLVYIHDLENPALENKVSRKTFFQRKFFCPIIKYHHISSSIWFDPQSFSMPFHYNEALITYACLPFSGSIDDTRQGHPISGLINQAWKWASKSFIKLSLTLLEDVRIKFVLQINCCYDLLLLCLHTYLLNIHESKFVLCLGFCVILHYVLQLTLKISMELKV